MRKWNLQVTPDNTHLRRFSRFHPGRQRRFPFLGFEFAWLPDRQGGPRVTRRTARKKLQAACRRRAEWSKQHRHLPGRAFLQHLNARVRGHYHYYGVRGNSGALPRVFQWVIAWTFPWLTRRGGPRRRYTWEPFPQLLTHVNIARPCLTAVRRRRVVA